MKLYQAMVRVRTVTWYTCTVDAKDKAEAAMKLEASMNECKTTYPCSNARVVGDRTAFDVQELT